MLIQEQSIEKFLKLQGSFERGILLLSPQSRASLAKEWKISEKQTHLILAHFFESRGIQAVLDIEVFIHLIRQWEYKSFLGFKGK
jgi:iron only hydrogenase large subunit-like protein